MVRADKERSAGKVSKRIDGDKMSDILVVVDMQNGFLRSKSTQAVRKRIGTLINSEAFDYIIETKSINGVASVYVKLFGWTELIEKKNRDLCEEVQEKADVIIVKEVYTCVAEYFIDILKGLNGNGKVPDRVFVTGVDTDCCVLKIATDLFERWIRPVVLVQYCDSNGGEESHSAGITCLKRLIGERQLCYQGIASKKDLERV